MDELTITKAQLQAVMLQWVKDARAGLTRSQEETGSLPAEQVADESTQRLWSELNPQAAS